MSFDMTHQLVMRHKVTFVLMFNGTIDFSNPLKEFEQKETTECKLVSDFLNLIVFAHLTRRVMWAIAITVWSSSVCLALSICQLHILMQIACIVGFYRLLFYVKLSI
jgi:hypothetical protein